MMSALGGGRQTTVLISCVSGTVTIKGGRGSKYPKTL